MLCAALMAWDDVTCPTFYTVELRRLQWADQARDVYSGWLCSEAWQVARARWLTDRQTGRRPSIDIVVRRNLASTHRTDCSLTWWHTRDQTTRVVVLSRFNDWRSATSWHKASHSETTVAPKRNLLLLMMMMISQQILPSLRLVKFSFIRFQQMRF